MANIKQGDNFKQGTRERSKWRARWSDDPNGEFPGEGTKLKFATKAET